MTDSPDAQPVDAQPVDAQPVNTEIVDAEIVDAEIVPEPARPELLPPEPFTVAPDYDERGVPSLDYVRNKIESRVATSIGTAELVGGTAAARSLDEQEAERATLAKAKLDEIRRSMGH